MVALLTGNAVIRLTSEYPSCNVSMITDANDMMNSNTSVCTRSLCNDYSVEIAVTLSLTVGIIMVSIGLQHASFNY